MKRDGEGNQMTGWVCDCGVGMGGVWRERLRLGANGSGMIVPCRYPKYQPWDSKIKAGHDGLCLEPYALGIAGGARYWDGQQWDS